MLSESAIDDTEDEPGRRTITIDEDTPRRGDSFQPRLRRAASAGFARAATFERILSNTFRRRRRDGSPASRASRRSSMTLPYFTFQPTVGRNSLFLGLTEQQREELGGVEYRAVKLLLKVLIGTNWEKRRLTSSILLWAFNFKLDLSCTLDCQGWDVWTGG